MKRLLFLLFLGLFLQSPAFADTYEVKPEQSSIGWLATKVGGEHTGFINIKSGSMEFEDGEWVGGEATIDMDSITVTDIKNPSTNQKLVNHLKSEDFFDVENHNTAKIEVTEITPREDGSYDVEADITIKDITHNFSFQTNFLQVGNTITAEAMINIDRTLFDVRYGSGKFFEDLGDKLIHDEFALVINILAEKK